MKVIDMHCDTISILYHRPELNLRDNDLNISISKMLQGDCSFP